MEFILAYSVRYGSMVSVFHKINQLTHKACFKILQRKDELLSK